MAGEAQDLMGAPTRDGEEKIKRFIDARRELERAQSNLNRAECEMKNSQNALGAWLMPKDAKVGETIGIWYAGALLAVTCDDQSGNGTYRIVVRQRNRHTVQGL